MARRTSWEDTLVNTTFSAGASTVVLHLMASLDADHMRGVTLTRVIAELAISSSAVAGAWGNGFTDIGIGMIERDALAAAAVPDPTSATEEPGRGWVWRTRCGISQNGAGAPVFTRCMFDIRAQRKIDSAAVAMLVQHTAGLGTSFGIHIVGIVRCLLLLP